jgi:xanthine/uracil/vitamin C permease (AzgA family)
VIAAVTMPLTYSIATGIGLGFITYALIRLIAGRCLQQRSLRLGRRLGGWGWNRPWRQW